MVQGHVTIQGYLISYTCIGKKPRVIAWNLNIIVVQNLSI
jgi:hypothetical protein